MSLMMILGPKKAHMESFLTEDFYMLSFVFLRTICNDRNLIPWGNIDEPRTALLTLSLAVSGAIECRLS